MALLTKFKLFIQCFRKYIDDNNINFGAKNLEYIVELNNSKKPVKSYMIYINRITIMYIVMKSMLLYVINDERFNYNINDEKNIHESIVKKIITFGLTVHPYILIVGSIFEEINFEERIQSFLVINNINYKLETPRKAVDTCFKSFFTLYYKYSVEGEQFFASVNFLTSHFNTQHDMKSITEYICDENECFRSFSSLNSFKKHLKQHNIYNNVVPAVVVDHVSSISSSAIENNELWEIKVDNTTNNETPNKTVEAHALSLSCKWYGQLGIRRNKVQDILDDVQFFMQSCLSILKLNIDKNRQVFLMIMIKNIFICDPFVKMKTKHLRLKILDDIRVLIRPVKNIIGYKMDDKLYHDRVVLEPKEVIPLWIVFKKIFEHFRFPRSYRQCKSSGCCYKLSVVCTQVVSVPSIFEQRLLVAQ
ncbi:hypothetical protein AGLY_017991 [Aphis glycines]|uniref:C2H2-type domain-containing protein n=1 Tax=Aphis glycines TaxID=307491 RepID=A0A6G0STD6_APHGL|nr:hypothetical protein AGLY_017991 [Aphis glycines]